MRTSGASMNALATALLAVLMAACAGATGPAGTNGPTPSSGSATNPPPPSTGSAVPGAWQGTMTFHMVKSSDETKTTESGDPGSTYHSTITTHDVVQEDITDKFTVNGTDGDDNEFGVVEVDLTGQVANAGKTLQRHVSVEDKHNALGCHFTEEIGSEIDGSWTLAGKAAGTIRFSDDGSYHVTMGGGESGEDPLDQLFWQTNTILEGATKDCPQAGRSEVTGFGQYGDWAHIYLDDPIEGSLDVANPGSVVDGSKSFKIELPKATITVTWHFVHEGAINLPHG